jgi:hypothetical protein
MTELSTEQAFAALEAVQQHTTDPRIIEPLRLALVRLRELETQPEPQGLTDKELMELMPEFMRDEFSYAAKACSDAMGGLVKPSTFRVALNTAALEYARAVWRWGQGQQNREAIND